MQRILGIDPGLTTTGYALIENLDGTAVRLVASGVVSPPPSDSLPTRLGAIFNGLSEVIKKYHPISAAIETVFMDKNASAALKLGQARGVAVCATAVHDVSVYEYGARSVKKAIVGKGNASKQQVQFMVARLLQVAVRQSNDEADAMALALCHAFTYEAKVRLERAAL